MKEKIKIFFLFATIILAIYALATIGEECPDCGSKMVKSERTGNNFCTYCDEWKLMGQTKERYKK